MPKNLLERALRPAHIVDIEFGLFDELESVGLIKAVRVAAAKRTYPQICAAGIRFFKEYPKDCGPDTSALMRRMNVQVVEKQAVRMRANDREADALLVLDDRARETGVERSKKPGTSPIRVETAGALETFAHGFNAQCGQRLRVLDGHWLERDLRCVHDCDLTSS